MNFQDLKYHILKSDVLNDKVQVDVIKFVLEKGGQADRNSIFSHLSNRFPTITWNLVSKAIDALISQDVLFADLDNKDLLWISHFYNYTYEQKEDLISACINRISSFAKDPNFFLAIDRWIKWEESLEREKLVVGFTESDSEPEYNLAKENDILFFSTAGFAPPSKRGIFGVGKILRKYIEDTKPYWKEEKSSSQVIYKNRMEVQPLKIANAEGEIVYGQKFKPEKRLVHIKDNDILHNIVKEAENKWKIKFWIKKK